MIIPICWVRECVVRNVMYLHWLFSGKKNASQPGEGGLLREMLFCSMQMQGNGVKPMVPPSRRLSQAWVPQGWRLGFEVATGACALGLPNLSLVEAQSARMHFHVNPHLLHLGMFLKAWMYVIFTVWKIQRVRSCQPLGHIQALPRKKAPIPSIPIVSFPGTISLNAPQTLQGRKQNKVILVFIDEKTEASTIWDTSFVQILRPLH